jgi:CelD/BcsL family acetyltransferase involved in cellulose biosynthesis
MVSGAVTRTVTVRILDDFEDPELDSVWDRLLASGPTDAPCLMLEWQRAWWRAYRPGPLMLAIADQAGEPCAIVPLYADEEMLLPVGAGDTDALDFIGRLDESMLAEMLAAARERLGGFAGLHLYHLPEESSTTALLGGVAARLGLDLSRMYDVGAPYLDLTDAERAAQVVDRRKLRKEGYRMSREGLLRTRLAKREDIDPWLDRFFTQHVTRWSGHGEAKFDEEQRRAFCRNLVRAGHDAGWLRFTMLEWQGEPAAFDITLVRGDRHLGYLVSRDPSITRHSPGRVLEAQVIRAALESGARRYEFGIGDQQYKLSNASATPRVVSWAMWPR